MEHRLFPHLHELARPALTSHEIVVPTIAATTTRAGLTVTAELDTASYPKGIKISDRQITDLEQTQVLTRHQFHGEWNSPSTPRTTRPSLAKLIHRKRLGAAGGCRTVCNAASSRVSLGRLAAKGRNFCLYAPTRGEVASEKP